MPMVHSANPANDAIHQIVILMHPNATTSLKNQNKDKHYCCFSTITKRDGICSVKLESALKCFHPSLGILLGKRIGALGGDKETPKLCLNLAAVC